MHDLGRVIEEDWSFGDGAAGDAIGRTFVVDPPTTLGEWFERQAQRTPEAWALSAGSERLTYAALNASANRLAHQLIDLKVGPEVLVGICLERSPAMIVAMLAVVKAGGAYLPLDPGTPPARLAFTLRDAKPRVVLTTRQLSERLEGEVARLCLDDNPGLPDRSGNPQGRGVRPDHPAYVIYTSGSTGQPKGAVITQQCVVRLFTATEPWFGFSERDVWTMFHSFAFDFSVWEIWGALLYGGRLVIVPQLVSRSPSEFLDLLVREQVTVLNQTPSAFYQLMQEDAERPDGGDQLSLKWVIFGGEALSLPRLKGWYARHDDTAPRLVNMYGITETTVHVTYQPLTAEMAATETASPIGVPIPDLSVYVLDQNLQPVPPGVVGELYVAGPGVARGYLNRPELTAERFLTDPWGEEPNARMYRSGDLALRRTDGALEYHGRGDQQVKLRGFRIELGEIESVLAGDAGVSQAAVVLRDADGTDPALVAYVVPDPRREPVLANLADMEHRDEFPFEDRHVLPNGLLIRHQNRSETEFVYDEVFRQECYLRHGIELGRRSVVFDVGANIGLFTLFMRRRFPDSTVFAFEPIPPLYETLRVNCRLYGGDTRLYGCGLSDREERATFTWYRHNSVISGRFANLAAESAVVKSVLRQQAGHGALDEAALDDLVANRLRSEQFECELRPLSAILAESGVEQIDLLKIDVEKSEWLVFQGIEPEDWNRIRQVVVEVHDEDGRLEQVVGLLRGQGFDVVVEQDEVLRNTSLCSVYARRASDAVPEPSVDVLPPPGCTQPEPWLAQLRTACEARLPGYMVPRDFVLLPRLPLTNNGKLDRKALPTPRRSRSLTPADHLAPRNSLEAALCRAFTSLLNVPLVGVTDSFFALGGHSLLATRLASRIRRELGVELPIRVVFEQPTVAGLAEWIESQSGNALVVRPRLTRETRPVRLPLSAAQQRMWFLRQFETVASTYHIPLARRLTGPLDVDALRLAVRDLLERHESLRTVFPVEEGEPWQKILPVDPLAVPLDVVPATPASLADQLQEASIRPFDLAGELPIRVTLCVLGPNEHVLLLVLHHIAADGTSLTPLWRDLSTAYAARTQGRAPAWQPLPVQYADYTLWQQRWLGSAEDAASVTARELQFWREALAGLPDELTLPTDRPRPRVASYQGGTVPIAVGADLLARLQQLARHENASLFMVLQGALAVLLSRLGAGTDIPLGTPIAGRLDDALHDQVGFYVNTLVMRTDLSGEPTFREVLRRVREFDLAAFAHQELSFEQLVQELQPTRSLARHPLFQVMLVLQNTGLVEESLGALAIAEEPLSQTTARFDLLWNLAETAGEGLRGSLEFADDLFDRESVTLLVQRFVRVLHQITTDADRPVSDLDVLLEEEPRQLLEWGRGPRPADAPLGILESFARRVAERPQALAVRDDRHSLTYADLALRVDQWATALRERGVGAESLVAIRLGRSVDFVVAMLATLRAGGAYLPLEEQTPEARLRQILESADPALLLTTRVLGEQVGWRATEFVDEWAPVVAAELRTNWPIATDAQAAYCIHTSGSTGRSKGIVGLHGTLRNLIAWQEPTPRPIRVAQFTAVGFDVSPQEILTALLTGGSLHVVDEPTRLDPELFVDFLIRERITDLFVPFIVLENLASAAEDLGRTIPELREVHQAGEALRVTPLLRQFFARHPDCRLHNHYGPAETHVVTACTLPTDPRDWPEQPTIGRPIQGIQAYVLDERLRLMPPGAVGELCFSGVGVNRGYLNSPEETAAKFVHDPWSERTGERLYRTGDLGRWRRDGTLDFLGRIDQQVKIRGVRVEPAEIERAILDQGGATQAAVVPWTGQRGETLLAAYVVPREGRPMDMSALRHHLASVLPAAMIPAAMIAVAQIPLTVNGKLDRSRLPTPQEDPADEASRPPTTTTQQRLAEMFGEILSQTPVGIDDCFFRLGGHSLLATRLASRIRRELGVELPIRVVFEHPTVAGLAEWIESQSGGAPVVRPRLTPETRPARLPLSAAQQRMWFLRQFETAAATYHIPLARRLTGPLDVDALRLAVRDLLERHESLRTVFPVEEGEPWQKIVPVDPLAIPLDVLPATAASLADQLQEASLRPFDLASELPIRVTLCVLGPNEHVLLLVLHHIAADGTSLTPLWRDLSTAYAARADGNAPAWQPLPVQYADYTLWQQRWLGRAEDPASVTSRELGFWREALAGLPDELTLPTDRPRPRVASYRGGAVPIEVGADLLARLQQLARDENVSLFMVLQGALAVLLSRLGAGTDIPLGTPIAGRLDDALHDQVGFYVNTLVTRTDLSGEPTFREVLRRVREFDLAAFAHQELPFEQLVQELHPTRSLARHPLFQVMLVLQNTGLVEESLVKLAIAEEPLRQTAASFDLVWNLSETVPGELCGTLGYSADLYEQESAEALVRRYLKVLNQVTDRPDTGLVDVDVLEDGERRAVGPSAVRTADRPFAHCLQAWFDHTADCHRARVALMWENQSLTYGDLDRQANRLAHQLIALGVGPEVLVAICLERSAEMIVAMLAVVKAGGAYLPLDAGSPPARLQTTLADAAPRVVVTDQALAGRLGSVVPVLRLDANPDLPLRDDSPGDRGVRPEHAAYVIYTSGSTGTPKGAVITQECVIRLFTATHHWFGFSADDVWTMFHSFAFDFSVWEIWGALLYGGRLVLVPKLVSRSPGEFLELVIRERVTVLNQTPSAFYQLIQAESERAGRPEDLALRWVIFGGEALSLSQLRRWYARHSETAPRLVNMYGITETTVHVTYQPLTARLAEEETASLIGVPIPDLRVYLLDDQLRPVPTGVVGELCVAGPGVARGYLNRPELSAERFPKDPFDLSGGRMYRSGDLARCRSDGTLEYLGRADQQVKLRGFRIELGEIEAALASQPGVSQAAVVLRELDGEDAALIGYVVPDSIHEPVLSRMAQLAQAGEFPHGSQFVLPNGLLISHRNKSETEFVYDEVFRDECYLRHGMTIPPRGVVFDVGANIGLFTLFVRQRHPDCTIHAFEPLPPLFDNLRVNSLLYGGPTRLHRCGLSNVREQAEFTWCPHKTVISGRFANLEHEREIVKSVLRQQSGPTAPSDQLLDELVADRLRSEQFTCELRTLSEIIAETGVDQIDLLKIDVEKSEWLVLGGITPADWPRIRQVVIEVHDEAGRLEQVTHLLRDQGFQVVVEQDEVLRGTSLYSVYARRDRGLAAESDRAPSDDSVLPPPCATDPAAWLQGLKRGCTARLPDYMVPRDILLLPALPLTTNGKLDRRALPDPQRVQIAGVDSPTQPRSACETVLCHVFQDLLRRDEVGVAQNFFDIGGHSLLATRLASRIRRELGVELPIRVVFEHPTVAGLAEWIESQSGGAPVVRPRLTPETRPARLPLSAAQQRMWFLRQFETVASTYHIPLARRLTGPLDVDALRLAVRDLLERHESLRTVFPVEEGEPWQKIVPVDPLSVPLDVVPATMASLADQLQEASIRPFDLASELPIRVTLCVLGPNEHVLLLVLHHIAGDGTSLTPLWRDLSTAYAARLSGEPPAWTPLPLQYADYTLWQQRWLGHAEDPASVTARELQFWREALAGLPDELTLPADRTRPRVASYRGGAVPIEVGADLLARLQQLARDENASLFMVLQGALAVLLSRLGAGTDIPLGTPIAGRLDETLQDQVGFYVNTLVTRTDLSGEPTFREVLQRVREFDLAAFAHQELPFEQLVQELQPTRSLARHPLFQVMVILQNTGLREESLSGVTVSDMPLPTTTAKFDLLWNLEEQRADGLTGTLEYSVDLFDEESVAVLVRRYVRLLDLVTGAPGQAISALELLDREEHEQLVQWSQGPDRPLPAVAIPDLFARQVAVSPEATAIACQHETWTYRQLDTLSDGIAAQLLAIGLPGDAVVGVCLPRNPGQIAVLLGILKAGGAYLALDPKLPVARLRQMTELAHPFVVITDEGPCGDLAQQLETQVLITEYNGGAATRSLPRVSPRTRAYVSFTSGSTGRPKGVEIEHQSVVRLVHEPDYVQLTPGMRVAHFAPLAFDASTFEIWGPLLNGGVCVLIPEDALAFEELQRQLARHRVETMWLTASLFNAIVDERPALLSGLTQVLTGGEALSVSHVRRAREFLGPRVRLINGYGPTECTTFACCHEIRTADCDRGTSIPIGQPIAHTLALVLDAAHTLVPAGVVGELYLGGVGLARGYAGQPELTAERFVADPLGLAGDGRLYRTGDLVRWRRDGRLEFVGRTDHQVKIRGFRIELEEIEALLRGLPGVADAAVTVAGEGTGLNERLVAHVVPVPGAALDGDALQQSLRRQLPEYMVPTVLPPLAALPLTSSGKVDRRELKRLADAESHVSTQTTGRLPQTPTEQTLARIWCELLSREMVDCDTSFFALGGHSLLAVRLFHRLEQALGKKLPLQTLFRSPTVATLAQEFDEPVTQPVTSQVVPLKSGGNRPPLFLLPSATGHLLFWQPLLAQAPPDLPLMGLSLVCDAAGDPLWTTLEATIAPLADAVMAQQPEGPIHLLGYSAGAYMAQELARQLEARGRTVGFLGLIDTGPATVAPPTWGERLLMTPGFLRNLAYWSVENNYRVSLRNAMRRVRHFGRRVNPRRGDAPVLGRYRRLEKQFLQMLRGHHTGRTAAPITLIRARCQSPWLYRTNDLGWHHYASTVNVRICPGVDHYNIIAVDHMPQLGRMIFESLETGVSPTSPLP